MSLRGIPVRIAAFKRWQCLINSVHPKICEFAKSKCNDRNALLLKQEESFIFLTKTRMYV